MCDVIHYIIVFIQENIQTTYTRNLIAGKINI
jgi:hypothetical protein